MLILLVVLIAGARFFWAVWHWTEDKAAHPLIRATTKPTAYIEISPEARIRLLEKAKKIQIEDPIESVLELMGRPGADGSAEKRATTQPVEIVPMRVASRVLTYYIRKKTKDSFDEVFDEHIHIFLDSDDYVRFVYIKLRDDGKNKMPPPVPIRTNGVPQVTVTK